MSRAGMNPVIDFFNTLHLAWVMRRLRLDIALGYFVKPAIYGSFAAWLARVPRRYAMIEGLGFAFTRTGAVWTWKRQLLRALVAFLYKQAFRCEKRVIFLNPDDQSELVSLGVLLRGKSFLLGPIGVDLKNWGAIQPVADPITFLLIARLLREKGIQEYALAAKLVKDRFPATRFILLGGLDDNPGSIDEQDVKGWVDAGILEWHGHVPVRPWIAQSSVYVLPSYREGMPVSTQEAMASGLAVITTDVPGCRQTVIDGVNGFLVPVCDSVALSKAMCRFIEQPELIKIMGQESLKIAREKFDAYRVNQRLADLLLEA
ncbi:MAG TPA: glycosyltransferase family 4 protein [Castellaniella sp.]|uniref:glycosyltransferase family 4 protein n=1 Tax=Castellaniella sp. TaxID=1955812 RepID=UPI002F115FB9